MLLLFVIRMSGTTGSCEQIFPGIIWYTFHAMETVTVTISFPKSILAAAGVREQELDALIRETVAVELYRCGRLSLGKAAELAGRATKWEMLSVLAKHDVWLDYTAEDAAADLSMLKSLGCV